MPGGLAGAYYLFVVTDATDAVFEFNYEDNNVSAAAPLQVQAPDLQVSGLTVTGDPALQSGAMVTVGWNDFNSGDGATSGNWYDHVTVVNQATGQTLVNTDVYYNAGSSGNIAAGGSTARSYGFRLPDGNPGVGNLQVTVTADSQNGLFEYNADGTAERTTPRRRRRRRP